MKERARPARSRRPSRPATARPPRYDKAMEILLDEEDDEMSAEQLAELEAALEEADRGEGIPAEDVLRKLRELRLRDEKR